MTHPTPIELLAYIEANPDTTIRDMAAWFHCSYGTINNRLSEARRTILRDMPAALVCKPMYRWSPGRPAMGYRLSTEWHSGGLRPDGYTTVTARTGIPYVLARMVNLAVVMEHTQEGLDPVQTFLVSRAARDLRHSVNVLEDVVTSLKTHDWNGTA